MDELTRRELEHMIYSDPERRSAAVRDRDRRAVARCVEETPLMAVHPQSIPPFPLPTEEEAVALQIVSEYLTLAGTQAASLLLGCPPVDKDTTLLADFSNSMLTGAALCAGLVELAEEQHEQDLAHAA
jgi:hypothetical protein